MTSPQNKKKARKVGNLQAIANRYYIFSEGVQTEPNYFNGFKQSISSNVIYKNIVQVEVVGVGAETVRVFEAAVKYVAYNKVKNAQIWCVYDKDSFPPEHFNSVAQRAEQLNSSPNARNAYRVAWSNQCIEYWFILHFDYYVSNNEMEYYIEYLDKKFSELGLGKYSKYESNIFQILTQQGNPKAAIRYAKKRLADCVNCSDSESAPATKVHFLIEELAKYLPDDLKEKYI